MTNKFYQKHKERLQKEARQKSQNLYEKSKAKGGKRKRKIPIFNKDIQTSVSL